MPAGLDKFGSHILPENKLREKAIAHGMTRFALNKERPTMKPPTYVKMKHKKTVTESFTGTFRPMLLEAK